MVAFAEIDTPETPSGPLSFGSAVAVAVEDDGAVADGLLLVARVCAEKQGRATFTGYVADSETGLLHARARQYSSTLGRFVGRDPDRQGILKIGDDIIMSGQAMAGDGYADGLSLYGSYEAQNSLDPFGLERVRVDLGGGTVLIGDTVTGKFIVRVGECEVVVLIYHGDPKGKTNHKWLMPVGPNGQPCSGGLFIGCYPNDNNPNKGRVGQRFLWEGDIETRDP
jgi:RHS repeat-associated protein